MLCEWAGNNTHCVLFFEHLTFQLSNSAHVDTTDAARETATVLWTARYVYYSRLHSPRDWEWHALQLLRIRSDPQEITCLHILCTYPTWSSLSDILFKLKNKKMRKRENALRCKSVLSLRLFRAHRFYSNGRIRNQEGIIHWWIFVRGRDHWLVVQT